jgi:hypothetical protein
VDLVFRLLHQFSDQFSSLGKLALAFHKNVCLSLCALLRRTIDGLPYMRRRLVRYRPYGSLTFSIVSV